MKQLLLLTMFSTFVGCRDRQPVPPPIHVPALFAMPYDVVVSHFTRTCPGRVSAGHTALFDGRPLKYWWKCTYDDGGYEMYMHDRERTLNITLDFMTRAEMRWTFERVVAPLLHDEPRARARELIDEIPASLPPRDDWYVDTRAVSAPQGTVVERVQASAVDDKIAVRWEVVGVDPPLN